MTALEHATALLGSRAAIFLGRESGAALFGKDVEHGLIIGPPRCGKTTSLLIPSVAVHPGPVVVTSTRADVIAATLPARSQIAARRGSVIGSLTIDQPQEKESKRLVWSITDGCSDWNTAVDRATILAATAVSGDDSAFFRDAAKDMLAGSLFAASIVGEVDRDVALRIRRGEIHYYQEVIEYHCGPEHPASVVMSGLFDLDQMAPETRQSVYATVSSQVLGQFLYQHDSVAEPLDLESFVQGWNTLYIVIRPERAKGLQPLVASLIEAITSAWRSSTQRCEGTLLLALDEVANVAPLPGLPTLLTAGAGDGIQCLMGMQEPEQANRWGHEASVVLGGATHLEVFGGLRNTQYLRSLGDMLGNRMTYDLRAEVRSDTPRAARFADESRLIAERLELERCREAAPVSHRALVSRRVAWDLLKRRLRDHIKNRITGAASNAEALIQELETFTLVRQVADRRPVHEPEDLMSLPRGKVMHISRDRAGVLDVAPWFSDPLWSALLL